jgi:hypothetical protein
VREVTGDGASAWWPIDDGLLVEVWPGRLRARDLGVTLEDRARAIVRLLPPRAVACRQTAVWVHTGQFRPPALDVVLASRGTASAAVRCHAESLPAGAVVEIEGLRVTSPARTAVDVARWAGPGQAGALLGALRRAGLPEDEVRLALEQARGLPGVGRARELLATALR